MKVLTPSLPSVEAISGDRAECDLVLVIGSSLQVCPFSLTPWCSLLLPLGCFIHISAILGDCVCVYQQVQPVAKIPDIVDDSIPQILINREPLENHQFNVELLGNSDAIVDVLMRHLGWVEVDNAAAPPTTAQRPDPEDVGQLRKHQGGEHVFVPPNRYVLG